MASGKRIDHPLPKNFCELRVAHGSNALFLGVPEPALASGRIVDGQKTEGFVVGEIIEAPAEPKRQRLGDWSSGNGLSL